jgi:hypothetical protein
MLQPGSGIAIEPFRIADKFRLMDMSEQYDIMPCNEFLARTGAIIHPQPVTQRFIEILST